MTENEITKDAILEVMRDPKNSGRRLWTASVVLDRMGIYRRVENQARYIKRDRLRVRNLLREIYEEGLLVVVKERHTLHSATWTPEVAYGLADSGGGVCDDQLHAT